ncbi:MAG TPA: hypothetical protein VFR80_03680, partial [Pyrinomonadaceae bacterium]|nr:hypothetical protein [Pyrinomonadaceae bacterium]
PGVSAEWSQGGESEWNSAAASFDETTGELYQDLEVPRAGSYKVWVRYADWANKTENFVLRVNQNNREVFRHEFGAQDVIDAHDEVSMYWNWVFAWAHAEANLEKGPARISLTIEKAAGARRHVDCVLLTNDATYIPEGRRKPDFAATRYLREWNKQGRSLTSLLTPAPATIPAAWLRPQIAGRDFFMPWNIAKEFWASYDQPETERALYPFHAEPIDQFIATYKGAKDVPIFASKFVVPVIYINDLREYLREGSPFLRYLRQSKMPFGVLINYGTIQMTEEEGRAAWALLNGELRNQFLGWVSGESIGYVYTSMAPTDLKMSPSMSRTELLEAHRVFYTTALDRKWSTIFHTPTGPMWDKLIPAQATSSTAYAHALANWGVKLLGMETPAVQPMFGMRIAFTRGAVRQFGGGFAYYHAANFGDTATTFTKLQNFAGPDNFFHSRYGPTMGPSLSWYRKSYYMYYMSGASAIYLEQGFDQFFKPGPGEHPFQLNPLGRITNEFMKFAEKHPDRGTPFTPVAFLLDPAHGWDMTDYPQWPFGVSQINRSDRALRELFGVAYFPGLVVEGEPASGDRQAFVSGVFGNIFDVIVAAGSVSMSPVSNLRSPVSSPEVSPSPGLPVTNPGRQGDGRVNPGETADDVEPKAGPSDQPASRGQQKVKSSGKGDSQRFAKGERESNPLENYRAVVVGGHIDWPSGWIEKLTTYSRDGGTVVLNAAQSRGIPEQLIGVRLTNATAESDSAKCARESDQDLTGQSFRYEKIELKGATTLIAAANGDPLVTVNKVGKGSVFFNAVPDLLGLDGRVTPFAAHMLAHIFADATPIKVTGDVEYLINRTNNSWVVTLFNNNGVNKPQQGLATVDRNATVTATISIAGQQIRTADDWINERSLEVNKTPGTISIALSPGGVAVVELK